MKGVINESAKQISTAIAYQEKRLSLITVEMFEKMQEIKKGTSTNFIAYTEMTKEL